MKIHINDKYQPYSFVNHWQSKHLFLALGNDEPSLMACTGSSSYTSYFILPYFFNMRITESCGKAGTVLPFMPVVVLAAIKALIMASSVAEAVNAVDNSQSCCLE